MHGAQQTTLAKRQRSQMVPNKNSRSNITILRIVQSEFQPND